MAALDAPEPDIQRVRPKTTDEWVSAAEHARFLKQRKAYEIVSEMAKGRLVLDVGCGAGYGTHMLGAVAERVVAVDVVPSVVEYCSRKYRSMRAGFVVIEPLLPLPFADSLFDVVTLCQVIEHIPCSRVKEFLSNIKRTMRVGGILFLTTPNRKTRLLPMQKPWNEEHYTEYSLRGLAHLLSSVFDDVKIQGIDATAQARSLLAVKQNVLAAYCPRLWQSIRHLTPPWVKQAYRDVKARFRASPVAVEGEDFAGWPSHETFFLAEGRNVDTALDLVGICRKT